MGSQETNDVKMTYNNVSITSYWGGMTSFTEVGRSEKKTDLEEQ